VAASPEWRLVDVSIDPASAELRAIGLGSKLPFEQMIPEGAVAAINGGYFDEHDRPTGWLKSQGSELAARSQRSSGGVVALGKGALYVGPYADLPFQPEFGLQNSPRLVEGGGQLGIRSDNGKRASRTVACAAQGRLHLVVILAWPGRGPTLFETARLLAESPARGGLGCEAALNLDGGPSSGVWFPSSSGRKSEMPLAPIAYGVAVLPRR
jgi:hypothetical protein